MNFDNIPSGLKQYPYWCLWKYEPTEDSAKPDKMPYDPRTAQRAKHNDPGTFAPFDTAKQVFDRGGYDGCGVGLFDWLAAVDIDHCFNPITGVSELATDIISTLRTYTEISPSGTGIRMFFRAAGFQYDKGRYYIHNAGLGLEIYLPGCTNRYVTVTGNIYGSPLPIADCAAVLPAVLEKYMLRGNGETTPAELPPAHSLLTDDQIITKASTAENGERFKRLWAGDLTGYPSQSEADQALCNLLAFWCGCDMEQIDRLFRLSKLYREKWEREDYRSATLGKAVRDCKAIYNPDSEDYRHKQALKAFAGVGTIPEDRLISPLSDKERYRPSDKGNGNLFADLFRDTLRYCPQARGWYVYRDGQWQPDNGDSCAKERAKGMANYLSRFLPEIKDEEPRKAYIKNMGQLYSLPAREKMLKDAQSVNPIKLEELDINTDLFNVQNGTLHLGSGEFTPHNGADMVSKKAGTAFVPGVDCPLWRKTLDEIFEGRTDLIRYFQKVIGYAMLGKPIEKQFFILYDKTTNNGKSTITRTVEKLFGDYASNSPPELIAEKRFKDSSKPSGDKARLAGVRFISINEPGRDMKLDEAYVKTLTGQDTQTARQLYQSSFEYVIQGIPFINTNYLPYISDQTLFESGRVRVIPIERSFSEQEQDKTLPDRLQQPQELSGILNWALEGLQLYNQERLPMPPSVAQAVNEYRMNSDNIMRFMDDCTERDINSAVQMTPLHSAYQMWCYSEEVRPVSPKAFSVALKERGYKVDVGHFNGSTALSHVWGIKCTNSVS